MTEPRTETIVCPFDGDEGVPTLRQDRWVARKCSRCRLVFVSPRPNAAAISDIYTQDATQERASGHVASFGSPLARLEARRVVRLLRRLRKPGRLLEIGPGGGAVLHAARRAGWDVGAVELNPDQAAFIRDRLHIPCWSTIQEVEGEWDAVYHRDVLSHFPDPVATFDDIHRVLKSGGIHVFESGDGDFDPKYEPLFASFQFPDHLFFFSPASLDHLLDRSRFRKELSRSYSLIAFLRLEALIRRLHRSAARSDVGAPPLTGQPGIAGRLIRTGLAVVRFAALYGLGSVLPRTGRPQQFLVAARRVDP